MVDAIGDARIKSHGWIKDKYLKMMYVHHSYRSLFEEFISTYLLSVLKNIDDRDEGLNRYEGLLSFFEDLCDSTEKMDLKDYLDRETNKGFAEYLHNQKKRDVCSYKCRFFFDIPWDKLIESSFDYDFHDYELSGKCVWFYEENDDIKYGLITIQYDELANCYFSEMYKDGVFVERRKWR